MTKFLKIETDIEGLFIVEPKVFFDDRGSFFESYNEQEFRDIGLDMKFVQDNESFSIKHVLRGLHVQPNFPQGKLVRVTHGAIWDVAVDLRNGSRSFGKWFGVELSDNNHRQFYIPEGFAHGFFVVSDSARVSFKVTDYWHPDNEIGIPWNDPDLNIDWGIRNGVEPIIAMKDQNYPSFKETFLCGELI